MTIKPVNNKIIIQRYDQLEKNDRPFAGYNTNSNLGVVKYSTHENYPEGKKIYFTKGERLYILGEECIALSVEDIIAVEE